MHETSLMSHLMQQIVSTAGTEGAARVTAVSVWIGALTGLSAAHFREHFEQATAGTIAAGATAEITVSSDPQHPHAQDVLLEGIEVEV